MPRLTNEKRKGRVIPFKQDGDFFLRLGSQRLERNDLVEALGNYHRAYELEPENAEILLAIAEVLTEMHRYEQSNQLLFPLLSLDESPVECFFGIACNFLGLQEFSHAQDSLESYLALDPEGEFVNDALDMLDVIEDTEALYSMPGIQPQDEKEAAAACARGRRLIEFGRIEEAIGVLREAQEKWPDLLFVQNNLALAWFCDKEYEQAMACVRNVLEKAPYDVQGHCNLLLFSHAAKNKEGVERELAFLKSSETQEPQDWARMAVVYLEMEQFQEAFALLKKLQLIYPYDEGTLHRLAYCYYTLEEHGSARDCYDRLLKIDPSDTVAAYYRRVCHKAAQGEPESVDWLFHYEVPYIEVLRRVRAINEESRRPREELQSHWEKDASFRALLQWSLHLPDENAKRALLSMIAGFGDSYAERILRRFQLDQLQPDTIKQDVFAMLKHMRASEPYIAYLGGNLVQSRVCVRSVNKGNMPVAYQRALELCIRTLQESRDSATVIEAVDVFQSYIERAEHLPALRPPQITAMAAAMAYLACRNQEKGEVTKNQIAMEFNITLLRLKNALNKILRVLDENREHKS